MLLLSLMHQVKIKLINLWTNLSSTINTQNAARNDAMSQYNTTETTRIAALNQNNYLEAERLENTLNTQIEQFNEQLDYNRNNFNTTKF